MAVPRTNTRHFPSETLADIRAACKEEIDSNNHGKDEKERLAYILKRVNSLENETDELSKLRRYIFAMSALVHHQKEGGLTQSQINALKDMIVALLSTLGISQGRGQNASLYSDLHFVLGQISRKNGLHWRSIWALQLARIASPTNSTGGPAFHELALAGRAQRLGFNQLALMHFQAAEKLGLDEQRVKRAHIDLLRLHRLSANFDEVKDLSEKIAAGYEGDDELSLEFQWEKMCVEAIQTGDLKPMMRAIRTKEKHHTVTYLLEAMLWARVPQKKSFMEDIPKISNLSHRSGYRFSEGGYLFKCAKAIEECYDTVIPQMARLDALGEVLENRHLLLSVDYELLLLGASLRFLARSRSYTLANVVCEEYRTLSMKLSSGKSADVLGYCKDLVDGFPFPESNLESV